MTDFFRRTGLLPGTACVVASDAPAATIRQARILKARYGDLIQICDGTADEIKINTAITVAAGGLVHLTKGSYKTNAEVLVDQPGTILQGEGWEGVSRTGTVIISQVPMTNSLHVTAPFCRMENFFINGAGLATQVNDANAYNTYSHVGSYNHSAYNFNQTANGPTLITDQSFFEGKQLKFRSWFTITGGTYINGAGADVCIEIVVPAIPNIIGAVMESYLGQAILFTGPGNFYAVNIKENYFESAAVVDYLILLPGMCSIYGGEISGNYQVGACTYSALINDTRDLKIHSNRFTGPIALGTVTSCEIYNTAGIDYNTLTGLSYIKIVYPGIKEFYGAAAPTTGVWGVDDHCIRVGKVSGETPGWFCTTAPGIWKAEASLA